MNKVQAVSRDLELLRPGFRCQVEQLLELCKGEGLGFEVFEAWRSRERQAYLYSLGRTEAGRIVTYSRPGWGYHEYGAAADLVRKVGGKWSWEDGPKERHYWLRMRDLARGIGCEVLAWEMGHVQDGTCSIVQLREWAQQERLRHGRVS